MDRVANGLFLLVLSLGLSLQADVFQMEPGFVSLETVTVGNPDNPADTTGFGAVAYPFKIGKFEVTAAQYTEFLNAKAKKDPYGLYDDNILESEWGFKLERQGEEGAYSYSVDPQYANRPIVKVTFWDACRFCNWLHNGQGDGDTETGAYTLNGRMDDDNGTIRRNPSAKWFLPSEDEWYKAAYFDPKKPDGAGYWDYPTRSDSAPNPDFSGSNSANLNIGSLLSPVTTAVGSFANSGSAYGTFDQGGNISEWTESVGFPGNRPNRCLRGGAFVLGDEDLMASSRNYAPPTQSHRLVGFRVAGTVTDGSGKTVAALGAGVSSTPAGKADLWASPRELRGKKFIGGGLYTTNGGENAITPRFLATHPEFVDSYPFDGIVVPAVLSPEWVASLGLTKRLPGGKIPWQPGFLHYLMWNTVRIPDEAVAQTISDLKAMYRGHLTDNFLICGMIEGTRGRYLPDFSQDADWAILEHNARLAARVCREGKLKGFWLDTEQYTQYRWPNPTEAPGSPEFDPEKPQDQGFPLGRDTAEVLRHRGTQWIKAVQAEFPEVKIMTTFAWSEDSQSYGPLIGAIPFLDGILEGMEAPGEIIHGHENTFYFGQGPGTTHAYAHEHGIPGDRSRYEWARAAIRGWRALSSNPAKYDSFVKVGMAAWVEDHPWGVRPGSSIGDKASLWSNLPLALAYSDEYVWIWAEKTDYGLSRQPALNPFVASVANQTFNTNQEAVTAFAEDFTTDPLRRGWYFDFDMLAIGKKVNPEHTVPLMSTDTLPYVWSKDDKAVRVQGTWLAGPEGNVVAKLGQQRRRYVHPLQILNKTDDFQVEFDFQVERFGSDSANPIVFGLFNSGELVNRQALVLRIDGPEAVDIILVGDSNPWVSRLDVKGGLKTNTPYRLALAYDGSAGRLQAKLITRADPSLVSQLAGTVPASEGQFQWDEVGVAQWDANETFTPVEKAYQYRLEGVRLDRK